MWKFLVRLHDVFILFLENKLGMKRTVKAYCLNIDLKHIFPGVVHFSRIRWFWLEINERIWQIPFFKCHSTDHSHTLKHLLPTFPVCLFSLPKKGCLLGEQSQAILTAWTVLRVCKKFSQSKQSAVYRLVNNLTMWMHTCQSSRLWPAAVQISRTNVAIGTRISNLIEHHVKFIYCVICWTKSTSLYIYCITVKGKSSSNYVNNVIRIL